MTTAAADVLNTYDVADLCRVTQVTVVRWVKSGRLRPIDPPNPFRLRQPPYRFRRQDVERLAQPVQRAG